MDLIYNVPFLETKKKKRQLKNLGYLNNFLPLGSYRENKCLNNLETGNWK
jgi:hypothetical protein